MDEKSVTSLERRLEKANNAVANTIKAENHYKSSAWFIYVVMVVVAFFISLGNSDFDWSKIMRAQFWIDFSMTFFGGLLIKLAWGKWGNAEGHKNPIVIKALSDVSEANKAIEKNNLLEYFEDYINHSNRKRKLRAIKRKVYKKLRATGVKGFFVKKKYWRNIKDCMLKTEVLIEETDETKREQLIKELDDRNFDLDSFPTKYSVLSKDTLQTGYSSPVGDEDKMSYSEYYQLFGRTIYITLLTFIITLLLAITTVVMDDLSWKTVFIFVTRFATFSMNAYLGFSIGKSGVETIKLNILKKIHRFLTTFLELNRPKTEVM